MSPARKMTSQGHDAPSRALPSFLPLGTSPQADPGQGPPVVLCLVEQGFGVNGWVCSLR